MCAIFFEFLSCSNTMKRLDLMSSVIAFFSFLVKHNVRHFKLEKKKLFRHSSFYHIVCYFYRFLWSFTYYCFVHIIVSLLFINFFIKKTLFNYCLYCSLIFFLICVKKFNGWCIKSLQFLSVFFKSCYNQSFSLV